MLKLYNTLSRKKEVFRPIKSQQINMYVCGPTVYGPGHVGHAKSYIAFDIIRRYLEYKGFRVKYIMNITDVHDDIFKAMNREKVSLLALTKKYTNLFLKEQKLLGIKKANHYPQVIKHIKEIISFVKILIKKGFAYEQDGSVYFNVLKFKDYGKLSGIKIKKALSGTRVEGDKYEKKEAVDFALWKRKKPGEPSWSSPWGEGRPGWHIECSVMSQKYLGQQFDIHGGAQDLIFPHHENEIAQSEAATGKKPFAKYWIHGGLLTINGKKMSKSLGNYIGIIQALKDWSPRAVRLFVASSHYRSSQDWNEKNLKKIKREIEKIDEFVEKLENLKKQKINKKKSVKSLVSRTKKEFNKAMDDDFNTPVALSLILRLVRQGNSLIDKKQLTSSDAEDVLNVLKEIDQVFNFIFWKKEKKVKIPQKVKELVKQREKYRKNKDWKKSDEIRKQIKKLGYLVEDTQKRSKIKKL